MKIAIVTPVFLPYHGGIGTVALHHAQALKKFGHEVIIITPQAKGKLAATEMFDGYVVQRLKPVFSYGLAARLSGLIEAVKDCDRILVHYPFFGTAELFLSKKITAKKILYYHMDTVGQGWKKIIFWLYRKAFLSRLLANFDRVLVSSSDYAQSSQIGEFFSTHPEKCFEIPIGVDSDMFMYDPSAKMLRQRLCPDDKKVVVFVGGMDEAHYFKGIEYLLAAMVQIDARLVLVGRGKRVEVYAKEAQALGIANRVIFATDVTTEDLRLYYSLADVSVLPSTDRSEAFGIVLLEAMACGKPVVASALPGVRSLIHEGVNGLTAIPRNADDLARKINQVLSDARRAQAMGQAGCEMVEKKYTWREVGKQLEFHLKML